MSNPELTLICPLKEIGAFRFQLVPAVLLMFIVVKFVMAPILPPPAPRLTVLVPVVAAVSKVGSCAPFDALNTFVPAPMLTVPFIVPVLVIVSLPAPSVTLPASVPLLVIVVLPDELTVPVIVPALSRLKAPPAEVMLPVMVLVAPRLFSAFVWPVPAAAKLIAPVIWPGPLAALLTVLFAPSEIAVAPELMILLLLTTLVVPADSSGLGVAAPVPTVAAVSTVIVTPLVVVW